MIERLSLRNFQCHNKIDLELDPKITTIIGPSDVGKSAIIRALRWLTTNRPLGDSLLKHGAKRVGVKVTLDGQSVARVKGDGKNEYQLNGRKFEAFGTAVPEDVESALNIDVRSSFQGQHDPPFWFSLTPGELASELNRLADLEAIDRIAFWIFFICRKSAAEVDVAKNQLSAAEQEIERLGWVEGADRELKKIEAGVDELGALFAGIERLDESVEKIRMLEPARKRMLDAVALWSEEGEPIGAGLAGLEALLVEVGLLEQLVESVELKETSMESLRVELRECDNRLRKESEGRCPICGGSLP